MTGEVENLILEQLRAIRADMAGMRSDLAEIKTDMSDLDQKVNGLTIILTMLAGHVHHIEVRVEALEAKPR